MKTKKRSWKYDFKMNKGLYLLAIPVIVYFFVFSYLPMGGLLMAFEDFKPTKGLFGSEWVGLQNFIDFFTGPNFFTILRNTLVISLLSLCVQFPLTIIYMELRNNMEVVDFLKSVSQCQGEVVYSTPEGDWLNLKSVLSQYIFGVLSTKPEMLKTGKITCELQEDYKKLQQFILMDETPAELDSSLACTRPPHSGLVQE